MLLVFLHNLQLLSSYWYSGIALDIQYLSIVLLVFYLVEIFMPPAIPYCRLYLKQSTRVVRAAQLLAFICECMEIKQKHLYGNLWIGCLLLWSSSFGWLVLDYICESLFVISVSTLMYGKLSFLSLWIPIWWNAMKTCYQLLEWVVYGDSYLFFVASS